MNRRKGCTKSLSLVLPTKKCGLRHAHTQKRCVKDLLDLLQKRKNFRENLTIRERPTIRKYVRSLGDGSQHEVRSSMKFLLPPSLHIVTRRLPNAATIFVPHFVGEWRGAPREFESVTEKHSCLRSIRRGGKEMQRFSTPLPPPPFPPGVFFRPFFCLHGLLPLQSHKLRCGSLSFPATVGAEVVSWEKIQEAEGNFLWLPWEEGEEGATGGNQRSVLGGGRRNF